MLRYRVSETDDGLVGEEGSFAICSFWLVSALAEIGETAARPGAVRAAARLRLAARAVRRGDRRDLGPPPRQLPPGVHPPRADQRGDARHPRRPAARPRAAAARHPPPGAGAMSHEPVVTRCETVEEAAAAAAEVLATAIAAGPRRSAAWRTSRSPAARRRAPPTGCSASELRDWRDVHLWYGDERCRPARRPRVDAPPGDGARSTRPARRGTRCAVELGCEGARGGLRGGARRHGARHRAATAWGPTATRRRCSPATRCCDAEGVAVCVARLAQAAARARDAHARQAQRVAAGSCCS